jgi:hypothetical protein
MGGCDPLEVEIEMAGMTINGPIEAAELAVPPASRGRRARRRFRPGRMVWGVLAPLLLIAGCGDDRLDGMLVQPCATQVITGRIVAPDGPQVFTIGLRAVPDQPNYVLYGRTDSTGAFAVTAPLGRYVLSFTGQNATVFYAASAPTYPASLADTLQLTAARPVGPIELRVGSCEVRVHTPAALDGTEVELKLWRRNATWVETGWDTGTCTGRWLVMRYAPLVPGIYVAGATTFSQEEHPFPFGSTLDTAQWFVVEAGRRTDVEFELPAPAVLRGTIDGSWQRLQDLGESLYASVTACGLDSTRGEYGRLSESGSWSITSYDTTPRRLAPRIGDITRWIGGSSFREATAFTPVLGETLTVPEEIESGILLRVAGPDSLLAADVGVELFDSLGVRLSGVGGGSGWYSSNRFAFANLVPGSYYFRFSHGHYNHPSGWSDCWHEGAKDQAHAAAVRIHERGELVIVETRLPRAAKILGHLQTPHPQDYENLFAALWKEDDTNREAGEQAVNPPTDPFGFSGMAMGRYRLCAEMYRGGRWDSWWYPGTWNPNEAQAIEIHDFGQVEDVTWNLPW